MDKRHIDMMHRDVHTAMDRWRDDQAEGPGTISVDEFELHDAIAGDSVLCYETIDPATGEIIQQRTIEIVLAPVGYDNPTGEHIQIGEPERAELERRVNAFLEAHRDLDCYLHDVAEYSC
jgi:hypothetical protein